MKIQLDRPLVPQLPILPPPPLAQRSALSYWLSTASPTRAVTTMYFSLLQMAYSSSGEILQKEELPTLYSLLMRDSASLRSKLTETTSKKWTRVAIEDWRWKYNNISPHRSLGYIAPLEFAQELPEETEPNPCWASSQPTASSRPNIDKLYNLNHIINASRLTKAMSQFG